MTTPSNKEKKEDKYTWKQIKQVVSDVYDVDSGKDSWGINVIYKHKMLTCLKLRLKKIKQYIK